MVEDVAKHYTGAQDMLQKHKLLEADISGQADRIQSVIAEAQKYAAMQSADKRDGMLQMIKCTAYSSRARKRQLVGNYSGIGISHCGTYFLFSVAGMDCNNNSRLQLRLSIAINYFVSDCLSPGPSKVSSPLISRW